MIYEIKCIDMMHLFSTYSLFDFELQKDPFYELEMPIRCELFTNAVDNLIERVETGIGGIKTVSPYR